MKTAAMSLEESSSGRASLWKVTPPASLWGQGRSAGEQCRASRGQVIWGVLCCVTRPGRGWSVEHTGASWLPGESIHGDSQRHTVVPDRSEADGAVKVGRGEPSVPGAARPFPAELGCPDRGPLARGGGQPRREAHEPRCQPATDPDGGSSPAPRAAPELIRKAARNGRTGWKRVRTEKADSTRSEQAGGLVWGMRRGGGSGSAACSPGRDRWTECQQVP